VTAELHEARAQAVLDELARQMPFLRKAAEAGDPPLRERMPALAAIAARLEELDGSDWLQSSVKGYVALSLEFLTLQRRLEQTGRYLLSNERDAFERVYSNPEVFSHYYLPGLLLSEALWPNHFAMNRLFVEAFVPKVPAGGRVLEVGVGTGYHLRELRERVPAMEYLGVDISELAVAFARRYADERGEGSMRFELANAAERIPAADGWADAAVCGEVLEHVEHPERLLSEIRRALKPRAPFFVTTVVFAANVDHIYMFDSADEIRELCRAGGWTLETDLVLPIYPTDSPDAVRRPMNYAALLRA